MLITIRKRQTDFDIADKLYFEPLTPEDVKSIVDIEKPDGAVVQFGGQTAIKLTESLMKMACLFWEPKQKTWTLRKTENSLTRSWSRQAYRGPREILYLQQDEAKEAGKPDRLSGIGKTFLRTGRTGHAIAFNDKEIEEFMAVITAMLRIIRFWLTNI